MAITIEVLRIPGTLFPRGPYDENASYKFLNIVESGGNGYVCLQPCTGIPVTNTAYWFKFVFRGEKGDAFTYADLTAEQKAELVRDATAAAQAAASSAQSAADDAAAALQKFSTIKAAIDALDPTSTEGSIQTLAAKQGLLESELDALGPESCYDVTARNSGATFASLAALLSNANLSTLVPTSVRIGGMSIRFVQTSDNKYVQYRYMSSSTSVADFTNVDNWQGDDDEPIAGSENLFKSRGIYGVTHPAMSQFKYINLYSYPRAKGNILFSNEKWTNVSNNNRIHFIIPVADLGGVGAEFYMEKDANVNSAWAFLSDYNVVQDGDASVISRGYIGSHDGNKWVIPENAVYLYLTDFPDTHNIIDRLWLPNIITGLQKTLSDEESRAKNAEQALSNRIDAIDFDTEPTKGHTNKVVSSDQIADIKKPIDIHFEIINTDAYTKIKGNASSLMNPQNSIWINTTNYTRHIAIPVSVFGGVGSTLSVKGRSPYGAIGFLSQYSADNVVEGNPSYLISGESFGNDYVKVKHYVIPDNASHVYFLMNRSDGTDVSPTNLYIKDDVSVNTEKIAELKEIVDDNTGSIALLDGNNIVIDNGTTYNKDNKPTSNRVGAVYRIAYVDNSFKINLTNITLDEGASIRISLLNGIGFTSAYIVKTIISDIVSDLEDYIVTVADAYKDTAKYLGIYIYNSTAEDTTQCFDAEVEVVGDTKAKDIAELKDEVNALDTRVNAVETALDNLDTNGDKGGDDCLYEKKTIQTITPYYLQKVENPISYEDGYYLENKVKAVPKDGRSFIFITDTHIELPDSSEGYPGSRNARHSDLLLSYIKKRCGLSTGIFGGDCIDYDSTNYRAAQVLSEYASEFFGVFGKNGFWAHGNHDCNSAAHNAAGVDEDIALISDEEAYNRTVRTIENEVVFDTAGLTVLESIVSAVSFEFAKWWWKMHYFKDVPELKTRFIVLESGDNSYGAKLFNGYSGVKWMQFDFVANALNTIPEGYDAVITCHQCGTFTTVGSMDKVPNLAVYDLAFIQLLSAYKMKRSYTVDINNFSGTNATVIAYWTAMGGSSTSRTFDMSEHQGSGRVLFITGHFHNDITLVCQTVNNNFGVARVCEHSKSDVEAFDDTKVYTWGDEMVYNDTIYAAGTNVSAGAFDSSKWLPLLDKDTLEDDAVFLLWRNRDAYSARYKVNGSKEYLEGYMTSGTVTEQSFDVVSFLEDKVKITKIGAGEDIELPL